MKKKILFFCFAIFMVFCQCLPVTAISEEQKSAIVENCGSIKETLRDIQKEDSRIRVYLGGYYETILTNFIKPFNVRLLKNNLSTTGLVQNQNDFADAKVLFSNDFISYQQGLEELINIDCKNKPEDFYNKLSNVREKRKIMSQDVLKVRSLISQHLRLAERIKSKI